MPHGLALIAIQGSHLQQLGEAQDGIERGAQLVAHAREKFALRPVRLLGFFFRPAQGHGEAFPLRHFIGKQLLGKPAVGDVQQHRADARCLSCAIANHAVINLEDQVTTVAAEEIALERGERLVAADLALNRLAALLLLIRCHKLPDRVADHLGRRVA